MHWSTVRSWHRTAGCSVDELIVQLPDSGVAQKQNVIVVYLILFIFYRAMPQADPGVEPTVLLDDATIRLPQIFAVKSAVAQQPFARVDAKVDREDAMVDHDA